MNSVVAESLDGLSVDLGLDLDGVPVESVVKIFEPALQDA